nr:uncharacterized protein LOC105095726 isoform X1 [Camelus dromedarius]
MFSVMLGKGDPVMSKDGSSCSEPSGGPGALQKHWQKEEEMCLGWRPTFRSSTSFLPKEPSLELPTVFTKEPANNTLDLGAWPDHRHGLPQPENHPSESLTHGCGAWMTMQRNVRRGNMRWSQKQGLCSACALCVLPYLMDVGIWSSAATADRQSVGNKDLQRASPLLKEVKMSPEDNQGMEYILEQILPVVQMAVNGHSNRL